MARHWGYSHADLGFPDSNSALVGFVFGALESNSFVICELVASFLLGSITFPHDRQSPNFK